MFQKDGNNSLEKQKQLQDKEEVIEVTESLKEKKEGSRAKVQELALHNPRDTLCIVIGEYSLIISRCKGT